MKIALNYNLEVFTSNYLFGRVFVPFCLFFNISLGTFRSICTELVPAIVFYLCTPVILSNVTLLPL